MICPRKILALGLLATLAMTISEAAPSMPRRSPQAQQQIPPPPPPQALPSDDPRAVIRARVDMVVVPVTVKNASGELVPDLRDDEFRVLEDKVDQKIAFFSADAFPLSAVVLLDDGLKAKTSERVKQTLITVSAAFGESDEVALGRFDSFYTPVLDFTTDNDKLITALKSVDLGNQSISPTATGTGPLPPNPSAGDAQAPGAVPTNNPFHVTNTKHVDDALYVAAQILRTRGRERRKMILIVSDGTNSRYNAHTSAEALKLLLSSDISVYAIGVDSAVILRGTTDLSRYAHTTGGDVYYAAHESDLPKLYAQVSEEARHQYTIGYLPSGTDRGKAYHSIEVRIKRAGLSLLTRDGYYTSGVVRP
jgi:Ca-activated chloride channel family protein